MATSTRPVILSPDQAAGILNYFDSLRPNPLAGYQLPIGPNPAFQGDPPTILDPFMGREPQSLPPGAGGYPYGSAPGQGLQGLGPNGGSGLLQGALRDTLNRNPALLGPPPKICIADARVRGNNLPTTHPNTPGAYGVPETLGSGVLDRDQWAPPGLTPGQRNYYMDQFRDQISGDVPDGKGGYREVFHGMSDNMGADRRSQRKTLPDLEKADPDDVLVELAGQTDMGAGFSLPQCAGLCPVSKARACHPS